MEVIGRSFAFVLALFSFVVVLFANHPTFAGWRGYMGRLGVSLRDWGVHGLITAIMVGVAMDNIPPMKGSLISALAAVLGVAWMVYGLLVMVLSALNRGLPAVLKPMYVWAFVAAGVALVANLIVQFG